MTFIWATKRKETYMLWVLHCHLHRCLWKERHATHQTPLRTLHLCLSTRAHYIAMPVIKFCQEYLCITKLQIKYGILLMTRRSFVVLYICYFFLKKLQINEVLIYKLIVICSKFLSRFKTKPHSSGICNLLNVDDVR